MIVFDCEVLPPDGIKPDKMSICSWWSDETHEVRTVEAMYIAEFIEEARNDPLLVGYNVLNFDMHLFDPLGYDSTEARKKTFDLYRYLWYNVTGGDASKTPNGLNLDAMCMLNLGHGKVKMVGTAAALWAGGAYDIVILYNKNDVILCRDLLLFALDYEYLEYEDENLDIKTIDCSDMQEWLNNFKKAGESIEW